MPAQIPADPVDLRGVDLDDDEWDRGRERVLQDVDHLDVEHLGLGASRDRQAVAGVPRSDVGDREHLHAAVLGGRRRGLHRDQRRQQGSHEHEHGPERTGACPHGHAGGQITTNRAVTRHGTHLQRRKRQPSTVPIGTGSAVVPR
jgi:hypothetical protein